MRFKDFVTEAPRAPKEPLPEGIKLLQLLMDEVHENYNLKLVPGQQQEAFDEAVRMMKRIANGADGSEMKSGVSIVSNDLKALRKALLPFPTRERQLDEAGVWIENKEVARTLQTAQGIQQEVVKSQVFMENLDKLLFALEYVHRLIEGRAGPNGGMGLDPTKLSFARASFKKLGIL